MIIAVLFYIFVAAAALQIVYYLSFTVFAFSKRLQKKKENTVPVSVIICAKNEAGNLQRFLPFVISQDYPKFEIVLINDASTDTTWDVMKTFQEQHTNIKVVQADHNEAFWGSKKYALTLGIKAATYEHLLFTDADCKPVSDHWIEEMANAFDDTKKVVLGYGYYRKTTNSFTNLLVSYETLLTAIQYFSYAKMGSPYMGVGRNLAYTKTTFFDVKGFAKHLHVKSGDDDLFIQEVAHKENTAICYSENSFTESIPPKNIIAWFRQKRRHISAADHYKFKLQLLLGTFFLSKFLFFFLFTLLLFLMDWKLLFIFLGIHYIIQLLVVGFSAKKLLELKVLPFLPILEICLLLFQFAIFMANMLSKPDHWK